MAVTVMPALIYSDQEYFVFLCWRGHRSWDWVSCLPLSQPVFPQQRWPGVEEKKGSRAQRCPLSPDTCCWLAAEMEDTVWLCLRTSVCGCACVCPACKWVTDRERRNFSLTPCFSCWWGRISFLGPLSICLWPSRGKDTSRFWEDRKSIHVSIIFCVINFLLLFYLLLLAERHMVTAVNI